MIKRLLIVGAGGFGREVYTWAGHAACEAADWGVAGFLDSNPAALDGFELECPILADPRGYLPRSDEVLICAIGDPATRLQLCRDLKARGARFVNLIHPTAVLGNRVRLGEGTILCPYSVVTTNVSLGDYVVLNLHATVGHDAVLGDGCTLSCHCDVTGGARLGEGVLLGSRASVLPGATVGDYAKVGAGSVVLRTVHAYTTVMGVPAKTLFDPRSTRTAA